MCTNAHTYAQFRSSASGLMSSVWPVGGIYITDTLNCLSLFLKSKWCLFTLCEWNEVQFNIVYAFEHCESIYLSISLACINKTESILFLIQQDAVP